ncbi:MAG: hypothetical protein IJ609_03660 [Paludibacteraceae bacterium]|nr:hypothetical protein [Paludibacteraceae bacterium]
MRYLMTTAFLATALLFAQAQTPVHTESIDACFGQTLTLTAATGTAWEWDNGETTQSIEVLPNSIGDTTIQCNVVRVEVTVENNMMANGDYETVPDSWTLYNDRTPEFAGGRKPTNLGFESDYQYGGFDWPDGNYYESYPNRNTLYLITSNAKTHYWRDFAAITPHSGNYFAMFDGGTQKGYAWKTNSDIVAALNNPDYPALVITQGTTYIFSYWSVYPERKTPAILQFTLKYRKADGTLSDTIHLGAPNRLDSQPVGQWVQTSVTWVSPVNSDWVEIGVYDEATAGDGNDFGLDDICFQNYSELHKSVDETYEYTIHVTHCTTPPPPPNVDECEEGLVYRKWDDVLFVDNSQGRFTDYQWYRDNVVINGANKQYLYQEGTRMLGDGAEYTVVMHTAAGERITACPKAFDLFPQSALVNPGTTSQAPQISPMPLRHNSPAVIRNVSPECRTTVFNTLGQRVAEWHGTNILPDLQHGYYILHISDGEQTWNIVAGCE